MDVVYAWVAISMFVDMLHLKEAKVGKEKEDVEEREMITLLYSVSVV